jgi:hypothetical protein
MQHLEGSGTPVLYIGSTVLLIILTPMTILQRDLHRSTFVVWELKRNVSVVRLIVETRSSGPPASQHVSCLTRLSAHSLCHLAEGAYTIRLLFVSVSVNCEFTQDSWKMYRYSLETRVFIVRERTGKNLSKYGAPGSILSGSKWWPLPAHVMMSRFSHNESTPVQISLQNHHWC